MIITYITIVCIYIYIKAINIYIYIYIYIYIHIYSQLSHYSVPGTAPDPGRIGLGNAQHVMQ